MTEATPSAAAGQTLAVPHDRDRPWTNWVGTQSSTPAYTTTPRDVAEAVEAVRYAVRRRMPIRPLGAGFSWSPLAPTGGMLVATHALTGIVEADPQTSRVWVRAGTTIYDLADLLWNAGFSLSQQGAFDQQTIVGAISTGTHGSGSGLGNLSSFVCGVRIIDGRGNLVELTEGDTRELRAARVSLGMLGVIVEVQLQVEPRYRLRRDLSFPTWRAALDTLEKDATAHRHYSMMWAPADDSFERYYPIPTPPGLAMGDRTLTFRFDRADEGHGEPAYHVLSFRSTERPPAFEEMEYAVPVERAPEVMEAARALLRERHPDRGHPVFFRFVASDDAYLSPFCGRDSVTVSAAAWPDTGQEAFFDDMHELLAGFDARGHWGKLYRFDRDDVHRLYPELPEFAAVREQFDPHDLFLNDHTRMLFA